MAKPGKKEIAPHEEWRQLGRMIGNLNGLLNTVGCHWQEHISGRTLNHLWKAVRELSIFRSEAEEEMFKRGGPQSIQVFYSNSPSESEVELLLAALEVETEMSRQSHDLMSDL